MPKEYNTMKEEKKIKDLICTSDLPRVGKVLDHTRMFVENFSLLEYLVC